jgi:hypothetical protein
MGWQADAQKLGHELAAADPAASDWAESEMGHREYFWDRPHIDIGFIGILVAVRIAPLWIYRR